MQMLVTLGTKAPSLPPPPPPPGFLFLHSKEQLLFILLHIYKLQIGNGTIFSCKTGRFTTHNNRKEHSVGLAGPESSLRLNEKPEEK